MGLFYEPARLPGATPAAGEVEALVRKADAAADRLADLGFCRALDRPSALPSRADADRVVVLGIGGSALGARSVHAARASSQTLALEVVDNVDPQAFEAAWHAGDPARTAWAVVSKSGGTTETLSQLAVLKERLGTDWPRGVTLVTGATGPLRELARKEDLTAFDVPEEVGGRFSVFTPAATVALALAGHDVGALLDGARAARGHCAAPGSIAAQIAALLAASDAHGRNVVTLWCYGERLEPVGEWFRQLWAESLGKRRADGGAVGQTPVVCVGSTDQHSMQQLMVEGPQDKVVLVLAGPVEQETPVPGAGHGLGEILVAMRRATTAEMVHAGCPAATLRLDDWSERSLGALLMLFLCATYLGGELLGVDPFGQPGVEAAKIATKKLLAEPGGSLDQSIAELLGEGSGTRLS